MPGHDVTSVNIHLRNSEQTGEVRAGVSGIYRCGSPWLCPVCAVGKAHERAERVQMAATATFDRGGMAALVVLTASHSKKMSLTEIKTLVQGASSASRKGRAWVKACKDNRILGVIVGQEVTYSVNNGWHYHQHLSIMVDGPVYGETVADVRRRATAAGKWLASTYTEKVRAKGGKVSNRHGWHVRVAIDATDASRYTAKGSMAWELSGGHKDQTKAEGSITPWDIAIAASEGNAAMSARWKEYVQVMPGTRSCIISSALAKELGIDTATPADHHIDEQDLEERDRVVGHVDALIWRKWVRHALAATFLNRVEFGGEKGFSTAVEQTEIDAEPLERQYQERLAARKSELIRSQIVSAAQQADRETDYARQWAIARIRRFAHSCGSRDLIQSTIEQAALAFPNAAPLTGSDLVTAAT
jgi:hypothetical protein